VKFTRNVNKKEAITFITKSLDHPNTDDEVEFAEWCKYNPFSGATVLKNVNNFLKLSFDMLKFQETLPQDANGHWPEGRKTFTLVPLKSDYVASSVLVNEYTMYNLLQQMTSSERLILLTRMVSNNETTKNLMLQAKAKPEVNIDYNLMKSACKEIFQFFFKYYECQV